MTSLPAPATPTDGDAGSEFDYPKVQSPTRLYFILCQGLEFFLFCSITLCLVFFSLVYVVLVTLTILPYAVAIRQWDSIPVWYLAPAHLQSDVYWFYCKESRRLASEWDVEKAKPLPLARLGRRFLSQESIASPQSGSDLITRLPAEIRLQIYKEVIVGSRTDVHITIHRTKRPGERRPRTRMHGQFFCQCSNVAASTPNVPHCRAPYPENAGRGILALSKTCKQVYHETQDLLYKQLTSSTLPDLPTFYFDSIFKPPFFLQSLLPQRLAQIKHIQLCYHSSKIKKYCTSTTQNTPKLRRQHNLQQCNTCNLNLWLDSIRKAMPNLKSIQLSIYLNKNARVPSPNDGWISRFFKLQRGPNGLRDLRIRLAFEDLRNRMLSIPGANIPILSAFPYAPMWILGVEELDKTLQEMIKEGAAPRTQEVQPAGDIITTEIEYTRLPDTV